MSISVTAGEALPEREKLPPWSLYADRAEASPHKLTHTSAMTAQVLNAEEENGIRLEEWGMGGFPEAGLLECEAEPEAES